MVVNGMGKVLILLRNQKKAKNRSSLTLEHFNFSIHFSQKGLKSEHSDIGNHHNLGTFQSERKCLATQPYRKWMAG